MPTILITKIKPNPEQPRKTFDEASLQELAASMKENGLIQPVVVERANGSGYYLVDGERRVRAAELLGWKKIEAVLRDPVEKHRRMRLALVANIQREDMSPMDRARAFRKLHQELGSAAAVAEALGLSDSNVHMYLKLADLPAHVQALADRNLVPLHTSVFYALAALPAEKAEELATYGATRGWSTSSWLKMVKRMANGKLFPKRDGRGRPPREVAEQKPVRGHYDALAAIGGGGKLPGTVVEMARATCKNCALYEMAGANTCRNCPLVEFLGRLNVEAMKP